jgi:hypothetical protein
MTQCMIYVVRDGLIRQMQSFFDTALDTEMIFGKEEPRRIV